MAWTPPGVTPYDVVDYPARAFADSHPGRLAAIGILHGMEPARVERCRVLELGCGEGANLVAIAHQLPDSRFVGVDLAAVPIARGRARAAALGLGNVELRVQDLMEVRRAHGEFDYVIAHGVYSWVPERVRERILEICGEVLSPQGIAFVSYLAQPGTQVRDVVRQFVLRNLDDAADPATRVRQARELLGMLGGRLGSADPVQEALRSLARDTEQLSDGALYHDWLAPINAAMRITDFVAQAQRHGLGFLGEAEYFMMCWQHDPLLSAASAELARREGQDVVAKEQLLDDLRCRRFRQTLLCRADVARTAPTPERALRLAAASRLRPVSVPDLAPRTIAEFRSPQGVSVKVDHPVAKAALFLLAQSWPGARLGEALLAAARAAAGRVDESSRAEDEEVLGSVLLACAGAAHVEFSAWAPPIAAQPGERPRASALARIEIEQGTVVTTLRSEQLVISDSLGAALLRLLDGTRDRAALIDELTALAEAGRVVLPGDGKSPAREQIAAELEQNLAELAQAALIEA